MGSAEGDVTGRTSHDDGGGGVDGVTIRPARADELPLLPAIERAAAARFRATPYAALADGEPASASIDPARDHVWVAADASGRPVGFALARVTGTATHLHEMDVLPEHGGRGVGRRLVAAVAEWAMERGAAAVTLTTFADVPWNAPFYARLGFRPVDDADLTPALRAIRRAEADAGLPTATRVVMRLDLPRAPTEDGR